MDRYLLLFVTVVLLILVGSFILFWHLTNLAVALAITVFFYLFVGFLIWVVCAFEPPIRIFITWLPAFLGKEY